MATSGGRRWLVGIRHSGTRAARVIRHPLWTAGTVVRGALATKAPATARRALEHLRQRSLPLRLSSPARRWFEHGDETLAIRWIGPINLRHRSLEALLCHAPAGVEYKVVVPDGSRFVCACAVSPQVWQEHPPRVEFTIAVHVPAANGWRKEVSISLDPGTTWTDRRWHPVSIDLPANNGAPLEVVVTLSTRVAAGAGIENAWALFGEPRLEWPRSPAEVRRSIATFASRIRSERASILARAADGRRHHDARRRGLPALGRPPYAQRSGPRGSGSRSRSASLSAAHQRHRAGLQHRPPMAARLHRVRPPSGLPQLGAVPLRRCVDAAGDGADAARV